MATNAVYGTPSNGDTVALSRGMIVRRDGAGVVRAQADNLSNLNALAGVVIAGSVAPGGPVNTVSVGFRQQVLLEAGLTPASGDSLYVSATQAGYCTTIAPALGESIGIVEDAGSYTNNQRVFAQVLVSAPSDPALDVHSADWPLGSVRYYACDGVYGDDGNSGYSNVTQTAAGLVAVRTLDRLLQIIPKFGAGRLVRAAVRSTNYASDTTLALAGYPGYKAFILTATADVPTAGSVAFAGGANDAICAGMSTATGMNAGGYNSTVYSVSSGTATITLQLNGGGAPSFPAMPARPYGCRLRFDAATKTVALRNKCVGIIHVSGGNTFILSLPLGTDPDPLDVCYIEMPAVTGPIKTILGHFGGDGDGNPSYQITGFQLGVVEASHSRLRITGCECSTFIGTSTTVFASQISVDVPTVGRVIGLGLRYDQINARAGTWNLTDCAGTSTGPAVFFQPAAFVWERSGTGAQLILYGGAHACGNTIVETVGTHLSTVHGANCQVWGNVSPPQGTLRCGLWLDGGYRLGRIRFSSQGANPCIRQVGIAHGSIMSNQLTGGAVDGNTDVGLDLGPAGLSGDTVGAVGVTIALTSAPQITGTAGDIRLPDGTIKTWADAVAGFVDSKQNRFVG